MNNFFPPDWGMLRRSRCVQNVETNSNYNELTEKFEHAKPSEHAYTELLNQMVETVIFLGRGIDRINQQHIMTGRNPTTYSIVLPYCNHHAK